MSQTRDHHPSLPSLPPIAGGWHRGLLPLAGKKLLLTRPADPDALLDSSISDGNPHAPYWGILWPAARDMASWLLEQPSRVPLASRTPALELGCGLGWVGLAGLSAGLSVTFSDQEPLAVQLALHNAAQNGLTRARGHQLDWHAATSSRPSNPAAAATPPHERYPIILGCDLLYESASHAALLHTLSRNLLPGGQCLLGDPFRSQTPAFCEAAERSGFRVRRLATLGPEFRNVRDTEAGPRGRTQILLLELTSSAASPLVPSA